jgi:hypothetical protein
MSPDQTEIRLNASLQRLKAFIRKESHQHRQPGLNVTRPVESVSRVQPAAPRIGSWLTRLFWR